jgi:hypothetical protein
MNIKTFASAVAVALALGVGGARAQSIAGPGGLSNENDGDLLLGFTNPTNTPSAGDLVYDLGSPDSFYSTADGGSLTPGSTYTVAAFAASDVTNTFGGTAFSNANVLWGVIGGNGEAAGPGSEPEFTLWAATPGSALQAGSSQSGPSQAMDQFGNGSVFHGTPLSDGVGDATNVSFGSGFYNQSTVGNQAAAGTFQFFQTSILGSLATTSTMQLYELLPPVGHASGQSIDLGTFTLSSTGLTFTSFQAIPEPSTYAAILGALTIGFVLIRRRSGEATMGSVA